MRPFLPVLFALTVPVAAYAAGKPLPVELLQAKTVYVQMGHFVPTKKDDDRGAQASYLEPCKQVLQKWGRLKIVGDPKQADVILEISSQRSTESEWISTSSAHGSEGISEVLTVVTVTQAATGERLWTGANQWAADWTAKIIVKGIVSGLKIDVEKEEKALAKQAAQQLPQNDAGLESKSSRNGEE